MKIYCDEHDSFYDSNTNKWLENRCSDPECRFCPKRPVQHLKDCECHYTCHLETTDKLEE